MADARILDKGYRPYDGPRRGLAGAVRSLAWHSVLRSLGLRRTAWAKVLPIASVLIAYVPAVVFVGIAAIIPDRVRDEVDLVPTYGEYYGFITAAIILFVALVGPEVLCPDRHTGMLGLYLASPLTRSTYLVAKALAVLPVLGLVTLGPPLLLLLGLTLADSGPESAGDFALVLVRIVVAGLAVASIYTAVSLAAASLTERRAVASAGVILLLLATSIASGQLVDGNGADPNLILFSLFELPFLLVERVYGEVGARPEIATTSLAAAVFGWTAAATGLLWWRYRTLAVTR